MELVLNPNMAKIQAVGERGDLSGDAPTSAPGMPMWVKVFVGIGILVLILVVVLLIFGGNQHGPRQHF